ncbi:DUF5325 family protein [Bacillus sp. FJAT-47783]|uniref:DUF5325 family protein n=1 Tax=Bacillus sp. FJAT-47783 TaxID=2922712 RepID=UPI001FAD80C0|nr:DUF5325 family protein [Bacillus sp. FJAT-47783]
MSNGKGFFLLLATLGALFIVFIGFSIGAKSIVGLIFSVIGVVAIFGVGFSYKKKLREKGLL